MVFSDLDSGFGNDEVDGLRKAVPVGGFPFELGAASVQQGIELSLAAGFAFGPVRGDPALLLEAMQCWVERALLDLENFVGDLSNGLGNRPAVLRLEGDRLEDEQIECALNAIAWFLPYLDYLQ
jgi:hypothetical protein